MKDILTVKRIKSNPFDAADYMQDMLMLCDGEEVVAWLEDNNKTFFKEGMVFLKSDFSFSDINKKNKHLVAGDPVEFDSNSISREKKDIKPFSVFNQSYFYGTGILKEIKYSFDDVDEQNPIYMVKDVNVKSLELDALGYFSEIEFRGHQIRHKAHAYAKFAPSEERIKYLFREEFTKKFGNDEKTTSIFDWFIERREFLS